MAKRMLIDAQHPEETRIIIADQNQIFDFDFVSTAKKQVKGNIYLAKITRVEPSLQAAFVEYGGGKQGFLPFSEIHTDYYQIPVSDRKRLMEEQEAANARGDDEADAPEAPAGENAEASAEAAADNDAPVAELPETNETSLPLAPAIEIDSSVLDVAEGDERPAYLLEGAIDESVASEIIENVDVGATDETPREAAEEQGDAPAAEAAASEEIEVETIASDDEEEYDARPKKNVFLKRYKIQEVIRRGQIVLVQVIKEERGNKGVSLTTYLSLAGRYCVLMPNSPKDGGISRKIASVDDRKRLKAISTELRLAQGMSVIIRTAGMDRTRAEIKRDFDYLVKLWNHVRDNTLSSSAPALIYEESDIIKRAIRDQYSNDIEEILVEGDLGYRTAKDFMKMLLPSHTSKIKHYKDATPLFYAYNIEEQLLSMHEPVVKLRSGGYIVINPTEALISIDVNSGRSTGERNIEETAAKTNLEAAQEVARQLRLRDLAGLIVIDFIDMMESRNRRAVEKMLKDCLKADRAKIQLGRISPFGLLEMSRQRLRPSIAETNMVSCPHCAGKGFIRSNESMSIQVIRALEKEASTGSWGGLRVVAPQTVALHLLNNKRESIRSIEERYNVVITVAISVDPNAADFTVEKSRRTYTDRDQPANGESRRGRRGGERNRNERNDRNHEPRAEAPALPTYDEPVAEDEENEGGNIEMVREEGTGEGNGRRSRGRRRRGGRRNNGERGPRDSAGGEGADNSNSEASPAAEGAEAPAGGEEQGGEGNGEARPRRERGERGGRGRRRWRERGERGPREEGQNGEQGGSDAPREPREPREPRAPREPRVSEAQPEQRMPVEPPAPRPQPQLVEKRAVESAPQQQENSQPKKGWWKKMIDLDN